MKTIIKTLFSTTQQATNFTNVQIELVPVMTAAKVFLRNPRAFILLISHVMLCLLQQRIETRNNEAITNEMVTIAHMVDVLNFLADHYLYNN